LLRGRISVPSVSCQGSANSAEKIPLYFFVEGSIFVPCVSCRENAVSAGRVPAVFCREEKLPLVNHFCSAKIFISEKNTNNTEKKLTIF
jgi:hypothetical protein